MVSGLGDSVAGFILFNVVRGRDGRKATPKDGCWVEHFSIGSGGGKECFLRKFCVFFYLNEFSVFFIVHDY